MNRFLRGFQALFSGSPADRARLRLELARTMAEVLSDQYLGDNGKLWRRDHEFLQRYKTLAPKNPYSQERKYVLREFARSSRGLQGDMAECGCYTGASAYFLAQTEPDTALYLFDSFQGLSAPGEKDRMANREIAWAAGEMASPEEILRENLAAFKNIHILRGWIPDRFPEVAQRMFRLVHIDVDLYQPTVDSLSFFYPRVCNRGVLIFDDYGFVNCPGAHRAVSEFMADKPEHVIHLPTGQGVIIRRTD